VVWQRSHVPAVAAAIGLVTMLTASRARTRLGGAAAVLPYVRHRLVVQPLPHTEPSERLALLPQAFVADLAEVGVLAAASARYRCLVL
jgi:hypothetical protein